MTDRTDLDTEALRARLEARRDELRILDTVSAEARQTVELDQTRVGRLSRMDALQGQAMAQATAERRDMELRRIDGALARMDAGDYGYCVACDDEIEAKRLLSDPATPTCIHCARKGG